MTDFNQQLDDLRVRFHNEIDYWRMCEARRDDYFFFLRHYGTLLIIRNDEKCRELCDLNQDKK